MTEIENPIISIELEPTYSDSWKIVMTVLLPADESDHFNVKEIKLETHDYGRKEKMQKKLEMLRKAFGIEIKMIKSSLPPKVLINEFPQEIL